MMERVLEIEGLSVEFATERGPLRAVDGVTLSVPRGRALGLVGESGSGKSVTALAVLGLSGRTSRVSGRIRLDGTDLLALTEDRLREVRGGRVGFVFQDPGAALDPFHRVGDQIAEALLAHRPLDRAALDARVLALLRDVGIPAPEERRHAWPHQLSGGMKQRVMLAIALACDPALLIADEPTTALDVTVQAQILALMKRLQRERDMSLLLISHDLGLVSEACDEIAVMYAGRIVERGPAHDVLRSPRHPYTAGLLASTPRAGSSASGETRLREIPGVVPDLRSLPQGCRFHERCSHARSECRERDPDLVTEGLRSHRCLFPVEPT